ncbi:hypothetical protein Tco_0571329 [Tanacetum coccineum]
MCSMLSLTEEVVRVTEQCEVLFAMGKCKDTVLSDIVDMDACHVLLGRPWKSDLNVVHRGKENTYTFSKDGHKFTLCPYSDKVQATTKEKKNQIMLYSTRNKEKNICATTIPPDQVLNPIKNSLSSSFQEGENDGGPELAKKKKG